MEYLADYHSQLDGLLIMTAYLAVLYLDWPTNTCLDPERLMLSEEVPAILD